MIRLEVEALIGDPKQGGWCEVCALPSMLEATIVIAIADSVATSIVVRACTECERVLP